MTLPKTWFDPTESSFAEFVHTLEISGGEDPRLRSLLRQGFHIVHLPRTPKVSIIISTYNQVDLLRRNLNAIRAITTYENYEIIIATNDLDRNPAMREFLDTVDCPIHVHEGRFSYAALNNSAAARATGEFLLLLNDDIEILTPQWIEHLLRLGLDDSVGAVGGKVILNDGRLQDGGTLLWRDHCDLLNYGLLDDPAKPEYNYVHDVNQCNACVMIRRDAFDAVGGFDTSYLRIYGEDTDFFLAIKEKLGLRILYQPLVAIMHHAGKTVSTMMNGNMTRIYSLINRRAICDKRRKQLERHMTWMPENVPIAKDRNAALRVLYVTRIIPEPHSSPTDAGICNTLAVLASIGSVITLWATGQIRSEPYATELQQKGIEVIYGRSSFEEFLEERRNCFDLSIIHTRSYYVNMDDQIRGANPNCAAICHATDLYMSKPAEAVNRPDESRSPKTGLHALLDRCDHILLEDMQSKKLLEEKYGTDVAIRSTVITDVCKTFDAPHGACSHVLPEDLRLNILGAISGTLAHSNLYSRYRRLISRRYQGFLDLNLLSHMKHLPLISVVVDAHKSDGSLLGRCIESIIMQEYENMECHVVNVDLSDQSVSPMVQRYCGLDTRVRAIFAGDDGQNELDTVNKTIQESDGQYVVLVRYDCELCPDALFHIVKTANMYDNNVGSKIIYSDHADRDLDNNARDLQYKPDWSPELLLSHNYVGGGMIAYEKDLIKKVGWLRADCAPAQDYDLLLRASESVDDDVSIRHISKVLYYRSHKKSKDQGRSYIKAGRLAVSCALRRRKIQGSVMISEGTDTSYKIDFRSGCLPPVSIIMTKRADCDESSGMESNDMRRVTHTSYDITTIVCDDSSKDARDHGLPHDAEEHTVSADAGRKTSSSASSAIQKASSEYILLVDGREEAVTPSLIKEMSGWLASDEKIGMVGAEPQGDGHTPYVKAYPDPDMHDPARRTERPADEFAGHVMRTEHVCNLSAISTRLAMIRKSAYKDACQALGRSISPYNSAEMCREMRGRGYRIVCTPHARVRLHDRTSDTAYGMTVSQKDETWEITPARVEDALCHGPSTALDNISLIDGRVSLPRILFTTSSLFRAGASIATCMLAHGFRKKGYRVTVFSPVDGPLREWCMRRDVDVFIDLKLFYKADADVTGFLRGFDLICINSLDSHALVRKALTVIQLARIPIVWAVHESEREKMEKNGADLSLLGQTSAVVFVADATRRMYEDHNSRDNFMTIPSGVDIERIDQFKTRNSKKDLRKKHGFDNYKKIIIIVGCICERKGQLYFAKAAASMLRQNQDLLFLIIGQSKHSEADYLECVTNFIKNCRHSSDIRILPNTEDIFDYYVMADIFVCASNNESLPLVVFEAMAFELPIVATNIYGIPEQISDRKEGLLIEPDSADSIEEGISRMLENPDMARTMAENARKRAYERHGFEQSVRKHEKTYRRIINDLIG